MYLYEKHSDASDELISILWKIVSGLFVMSMLSFCLFLASINRDYIKTFFNTQTGQEFLCETWRNAKVDKEKFYVFSKHKSYYKSINKELEEWLLENWDKWEEDKEEWFNIQTISKIPDELIPKVVMKKYGGKKGRRKSDKAAIKAEVDKEVEEEKERKASLVLDAEQQMIPLG